VKGQDLKQSEAFGLELEEILKTGGLGGGFFSPR